MNTLTKTARLGIDTEYLLRQVAALSQISKRQLTWDEFGEGVARGFNGSPENFRIISDEQLSGDAVESSPQSSRWSLAKDLVHDVFTREEQHHVALRKRLGLSNSSTLLPLHNLSLWLAGELRLSVTVTRPMVAAMLYAVAKSPAGWEILRTS